VDQTEYFAIKFIHISCATFSILGFTIPGWLVNNKNGRLDSFIANVLPLFIDTVLLVSAIALVMLSGQYPISNLWITVKIVALLVYIGVGVCFIRLTRTKLQQSYFFTLAFFTLALITAALTILDAVNPPPLPLFN